VAIPTIQRSLHLSVSGLEWVVSSYLLTVAGLLLVAAGSPTYSGGAGYSWPVWRSSRCPPLVAGLAGSGGVLIASRAIQGNRGGPATAGHAGHHHATFTNVRREHGHRHLGRAGALALATGPALGGLISQHLQLGLDLPHHVPVGVLTFVITMFYVAESRAESTVPQLDLPAWRPPRCPCRR
jgi:hypothetical protein